MTRNVWCVVEVWPAKEKTLFTEGFFFVTLRIMIRIILGWLKKHFIPHHENEHRPHLLRGQAIQGIVTLVILIEMIFFLSPVLGQRNTRWLAAVIPDVMSELTNNERQAQNLPVLVVNPVLNQAAQAKAVDMATKGYFAHISPEGKNPWYWLDSAGYKYEYAGENLAVNFSDSADVTRAWMESPTHRENIVRGNYTEVGTGVATGIYKGKEAIFVAQVYANPLPNSSADSVQNIPEEEFGVPLENESSSVEEIQEPEQLTVSVESENPNPEEVQGQTTGEESTEVVGTTGAIVKQAEPNAPVETESSSPEEAQEIAVEEENMVAINTEDTAKIVQANVWQKAVASPRNTTNLFLVTIFTFITLVLLLYALIRAKNHHLDLLMNGMIVLAFILVIFVMNFYMSGRDTIILEPAHYSKTSVTR